MNIDKIRERTELLFKDIESLMIELSDLDKLRDVLSEEDRILAQKRLELDNRSKSLDEKENLLTKERAYVEAQQKSLETQQVKIDQGRKELDSTRVLLSQAKNNNADIDKKMQELKKREELLVILETADRERKKVLDKRESKIKELMAYTARMEQLTE